MSVLRSKISETIDCTWGDCRERFFKKPTASLTQVRVAFGIQRGGIVESAFRERLKEMTGRWEYLCDSQQ